MRNHLPTRSLLTATAVGLLLVPACSSEGTDDAAAFCDAVVETDVQFTAMQGPNGDPAAVAASLEAVENSTPDELADQSAFVIEEANAMLAGAGAEEGPGEEFNANYGEMVAWMADNCDFPVVDVTAEEYAFEGIPETVAAGETVISLANTGAQVHEVLLLRVNDGVTQTINEILALPDEEAQTMVTNIAAAFASPGEEGWATTRLEKGNYVAICFLPEGATPEAMAEMQATGVEPEGAPHFTLGMISEFTVE